jgi:hypothetical protein
MKDMTEEQKEILLIDLSARLPYGVKCAEVYPDGNKFENEWDIIRISKYVEDGVHISNCKTIYGYCSQIQNIKPYLFPLSSMNEEQANELFNLFGISLLDSVGRDYIKINECTGITFFLNKGFDVETHLDKLINWLNTNHFDYRGLIPMGLAIDATNKNIY